MWPSLCEARCALLLSVMDSVAETILLCGGFTLAERLAVVNQEVNLSDMYLLRHDGALQPVR